MGVMQRIVDTAWRATHRKPSPVESVGIDDLSAIGNGGYSAFDGEKYAGGFGGTGSQYVDYWTLRERSVQLFNENLYARGLIRRLVTNEISTGLTPECAPDEEIIGLPADSLDDWTETTENRFGLWGKNPQVCDWLGVKTFGSIQEAARAEALISGDVLVVLRFNQRTKLPQVQLISGSAVQTPLSGNNSRLREGHTIEHGVEMDANRRVVAHWIRHTDLTYSRLPAYGARTGRRMSWLVYGTDKRLDDVRGQPLLAIVLQSLKEIDRYRDAAQRKAVINSMLAMFIKKTEDKMGTLPMTSGAVRRDQVTGAVGDSGQRDFSLTGQIPGMVIEQLQHGEEPVGFNSAGTDIDFATFEEAIIQSVAWANEVPPEILRLSFSSNYSASQAAINEFKIYLNKVWVRWGDTFCTPIYNEWLISEVLQGKTIAPGLLESWRDHSQYDVFGAWVAVDWYGSVKVTTDMLKQVKSSDLLVAGGYSTRSRESRITTGLKYSKNIKRLKRENELLVDVMRPVMEMQAEIKSAQMAVNGNSVAESVSIDALEESIDSYLESVDDR